MPAKLTSKQKDIIRLLREGVSQNQAIRAVKVSRTTFFRWKADDDMRALIDGAIKEGEDFRKRLRNPAKAPEVVGICDETWKEQFLTLYVELKGQVGEAARAAGVRVVDVLECRNPDSKHYDETFDRAFLRCKQVIDQSVEDRVLHKILSGPESSQASAKWWLERRRSDEFGNKQKLEVDDQRPVSQITAAEAMEILAQILAPKEPVALEAEFSVKETKQLAPSP